MLTDVVDVEGVKRRTYREVAKKTLGEDFEGHPWDTLPGRRGPAPASCGR